MNILLSLMILTAQSAAPTPAEIAEAVEVFSCDFEGHTDKNFDLWPDDWKRGVGRGFPRYVKAEIVDQTSHDAPQQNRYLRIQLDGGAAAIYSPPVAINPQFSYVLSGLLKTDGLKHDVAYYSITMYDDEGNRIQSQQSAPIGDQPQWTKVEIGPVTPTAESASTVVVGLHLEPTGKKEDLTGSAMFDEIHISRLPRMSLETNRKHNVYTRDDELLVMCEVSGISLHERSLRLELLNVDGELLAHIDRRLTRSKASADGDETGFGGAVTWEPPISTVGFYRVRANLKGRTDTLLVREITLVVAPDMPSPDAGEFGWSIPTGEDPLPLKSLASLLQFAGVNWVKFPVWESEHDRALADRIAAFVERLSIHNIETIAVLDQPPASLRSHFGDADPLPVASVFVEPELWQPAVNPVMTRLSMKVQWWQLGGDDDTSFIGFAELQKRVREIKKHLDKFGQEIRLGISWHWLHEPPSSRGAPWQFLSFTEGTSFTKEELRRYLSDGRSGPSRWIMLKPLPKTRYALPVRIRDLVTRMLVAKMNGAGAIFMPNPFDDEHGLMNRDGTPAELLLPWQTTARLVAGTTFLGSIQLPHGSENYIFSRGDETVMVAWNQRPTQETIFLGQQVKQIDVWGHSVSPPLAGHRQVIEVGPTPTFITGINRSIALWRMGFQFDKRPLASVFGHAQSTLFQFSNTFKQGVGGRMELHNSEMWDMAKGFELKLMAGGRYDGGLQVVLDSNTRTGLQPVRIDFDITADRNYKFSIYRTIQIGLGDIVIDLQTHLDSDKNLIVTQTLINQTDEFVSFDCLLFAPNRRRQRIQVFNLGRGRNTQNYYLPNGEQLIGETLWIRAEEIGGQRMLNYHIAVGP